MREEKYYEVTWKEFKEKYSSCAVMNIKIKRKEFDKLLAENSTELYGMAYNKFIRGAEKYY